MKPLLIVAASLLIGLGLLLREPSSLVLGLVFAFLACVVSWRL